MDVSFTRDPCVFESLRLSGEELQTTDIVKILGVKISKDLKWDVHVSDIIKCATVIHVENIKAFWFASWRLES